MADKESVVRQTSEYTDIMEKNHMEIPWHDYAKADSNVLIAEADLIEKASVIGRVGLMMLSCGTGAWRVRTSMNRLSKELGVTCTVINTNNVSLLALNVAAVLAGAVCGDHISPISDTTILASAGAQCNHINHVSTQIPYAMTVAGCCLAGYLVGGFTGNGWLALIVGLVLELIVLAVLIKKCGKVNLE